MGFNWHLHDNFFLLVSSLRIKYGKLQDWQMEETLIMSIPNFNYGQATN